MNSSCSLYPSQQTIHVGWSLEQPPMSTCTSAATPGQVVFNIGHPPQLGSSPRPVASAPQPAAYAPQPTAYAPQPAAYAPQPAAYAPQPAAYAPQPAAYAPQTAAYAPQPATYAPQPNVYPSKPASYTLQPTVQAPEPTSYPQQPTYSPQYNCSPQQPTPFYPQLSQANYHPTPVLPYPPAPEKSYPPTPATHYPSTGALTYTAQPNHSMGSHHVPTALPSTPSNHSLPQSGSPYPSLSSYSVSNSKKDSTSPSLKSQSQDSNKEQPIPSIRAVTPFHPQGDVHILRGALKSFITDKKTIINLFTTRSSKQRLEIAFRYKTIYGKDLIDAFQNDMTAGGSFVNVIIPLLKPLPEFLAGEVHQAISGFAPEDKTLVEILCTASNVELSAIRAEYQKQYYQSLEKDLVCDKYGKFGRLLAYLVQTQRPENDNVDEEAVTRDAQSLLHTGGLKIDADHSTFISILCTRSYAHLRRVFEEYRRISGKPLEYAVNSEFNGTLRLGLVTLIQSIEDRAGFFAERIYDALGAMYSLRKDKQLIRVMVSRSEIDLHTIKETYQIRYGRRLEVDISRTTIHGHYRKALLALIGGYF